MSQPCVHGSACFHPASADAQHAIACWVELQARAGGNSLIGRTLYPLLTEAGSSGVQVRPRIVYVGAPRETVDEVQPACVVGAVPVGAGKGETR